jgi:hypothetical protein
MVGRVQAGATDESTTSEVTRDVRCIEVLA